MRPPRLSLSLLFVLCAACGGSPQLPMLTPTPADSIRTLRGGDVVKVQVFGHDELSGEFPIDENDTLLLPIVGAFSVQGMSVPELRTRIKREFAQLYTQSFVSVTPLFRVAVVGEVNRPGLYSVDPTFTVTDILAQAGGFTPRAHEDGIRLIRNGMQMRIGVDARSLANSTIRELGVRSGDQITVPRKKISYETYMIALQLLAVAFSGYAAFR